MYGRASVDSDTNFLYPTDLCQTLNRRSTAERRAPSAERRPRCLRLATVTDRTHSGGGTSHFIVRDESDRAVAAISGAIAAACAATVAAAAASAAASTDERQLPGTSIRFERGQQIERS